jgi:hypothetical protein
MFIFVSKLIHMKIPEDGKHFNTKFSTTDSAMIGYCCEVFGITASKLLRYLINSETTLKMMMEHAKEYSDLKKKNKSVDVYWLLERNIHIS